LGAEPGSIFERLSNEPDISVQRALILSLGEYEEHDLKPELRDQILDRLRRSYQDAPDAGLHASTEWLLRRWKQDGWLGKLTQEWSKDDRKREQRLESIRAELDQHRESGGPETRWYVNSEGQTLVVVPSPLEFSMASLENQGQRVTKERLQTERIGYSFAIASHQVTVEQFLRFRPTFKYMESVAPSVTCPVNQVTWYEAAEYCNWLSEKDGLPESEWCYLPNGRQQYAEGMSIRKDYLKKRGYRLATEREWEAACRAGTRTSRYYGESNDLLEKYACYLTNNSDYQSFPVGMLKPNDWGLFDMHGNLYTWCLNRAPSDLRFPPDASEGGVEVKDKDSRVMRGSAFEDVANDVRTRTRNQTVPEYPNKFIGLRVARTIR
jgi:formylglycine-generating enzyme required for sulfatase activity